MSKELKATLLDSNLIAQTNKKHYDTKIILLNDYVQVYYYEKPRIKINKSWERNSHEKKLKETYKNDHSISFDPETGEVLSNNISENYNNEYKVIRKDNLMRSKLAVQRLAKANEQIFKSFITLTFAKNISNIKEANKLYNIWTTKIRKVFPDFTYICVPEYQKRGAIHYHMISNLEIDSDLIYRQKGMTNMYDIKFWNYGFSSAYNIDIEKNRLFSRSFI